MVEVERIHRRGKKVAISDTLVKDIGWLFRRIGFLTKQMRKLEFELEAAVKEKKELTDDHIKVDKVKMLMDRVQAAEEKMRLAQKERQPLKRANTSLKQECNFLEARAQKAERRAKELEDKLKEMHDNIARSDKVHTAAVIETIPAT
jgi:predicted  nucleic acid-binding Zn-ribbon protein